MLDVHFKSVSDLNKGLIDSFLIFHSMLNCLMGITYKRGWYKSSNKFDSYYKQKDDLLLIGILNKAFGLTLGAIGALSGGFIPRLNCEKFFAKHRTGV